MTNHTLVVKTLGEADNFQVWKYRTYMILEEIDLEQYFSKEVLRARGR